MIYAFAESKSLRDEKLTADDVSYRAGHKVSAREKVSCWAEYGSVRRDIAVIRLWRFRGFAIGILLALHHFYAYHVKFSRLPSSFIMRMRLPNQSVSSSFCSSVRLENLLM